jgi:hypothetical protein
MVRLGDFDSEVRDGARPEMLIVPAPTDPMAVARQFLAERCRFEGEAEASELREGYEAFCAESGERPLAANTLGKQLARRGIRRGGRANNYRGISLR